MIPRPDELSIGQRIIVTFIIVLVILFAFALMGWISGRWDEAPAAPRLELYSGIPIDLHLLKLDRLALEDAYHAQLLKLFGVWLAQGAGDATHFRNGLRNARRAYSEAHQEMDKREQEAK